MPKLAHLTADLGKIREKIAKAEKTDGIRQEELDALLDARFNTVSDRLSGALQRLMNESDHSQNKSLKSAVDGVVNAVRDTHGLFAEGMAGVSQEIALSHNLITDELGKIVIDDSLASRIDALQGEIRSIPVPTQEVVDFSGVLGAIDALNFEIPDISPQLESLEKRLNGRVHTFDVIRDPLSGLIEKIVVTEK